MAEITATLRDNSGNAKVGWTVQFRLSAGGAVVSTTADGTIDDKGNGSYVSNNSPAAGEYDVYACESGGTPALVKGYDNIRHVEFPLPEDMGGTGLTSLSGLGAAAGLEIGVDVQEYSDRLQTLVASVEAFNIANQDAIPVYAQAGDVCSFVNVAAARTLMGLDDSDAARQSLGLDIGADVQAHHTALDELSAAVDTPPAIESFLVASDGTVELRDAADTRLALGLDDSDAARQSLGLEIGVDVQEQSTVLQTLNDDITGYAGTNGFVNINAGVVSVKTAANTRTALGLGSAALEAWDNELDNFIGIPAALGGLDGFVVHEQGVGIAGATPSESRTILGLGTSATVDTTISGEANKVVKVAPKGAIVVPMSDGTITAAANTLGNIFQVLTGNTTTGTYRVDMVVITGVSGGNYTYGFETLYSASWGGA